MATLCLINARGGSKGIPNKNIKQLGGRPLIAWTIETAKRVPEIDRVVVSTDCREIADAALEAGAEVPFMRPDELATDTSVQFDTIKYTVERLEAEGSEIDLIILLQPTCPLRNVEDVSKCIQMMRDPEVDTVITLVACDGSLVHSLYEIDEEMRVTPMTPGPAQGTLRQDYKPLYKRVGSVYLMRRDTIVKQNSIYGDCVKAVIVEPRTAFDIDTPFDWQLVEAWIETQEV